MANQSGLQLIPESRKKFDLHSSGENKIIWIGTSVLVLALALTLGLSWYAKSQEEKITNIDSQILELEKRRNKENEKDLVTFTKQASQISGVLSSHIFWTKGLEKIENSLQPQVQILSVNGDVSENKFEFKAIAISYTVLARQIASFNSEPSFQDVVVGEIKNLEDGRIEFSTQLIFNKERFLNE